VWKIIDENISNENKVILCKNLKITGKFIFNNPNSYKELQVPWEVIKSELRSFGEREVIEKIQNTTYITRGMISNSFIFPVGTGTSPGRSNLSPGTS